MLGLQSQVLAFSLALICPVGRRGDGEGATFSLGRDPNSLSARVCNTEHHTLRIEIKT
jgi:hypothetical protein